MTLEQPSWLWLCVVPDPPPYGETHISWTVVEGRIGPSPVGDDQFWLGVSNPARRWRPNSAADRVAALLRHGTTPEDTMPVLTRSLMESIWVAFTRGRKDRFSSAEPSHLRHFLRFHLGGIVFVREAAGPDSGDYDEELDRMMRESAAQAERAISQSSGAHVMRKLHWRGDDEPGDGGRGGVREPRQPLPDPPPRAAAIDPDEDQPRIGPSE
jgi:hypothetical protein